tara:strand:- start:1483 stop:2196 length:714 start_codon:yes stop_codon:yes gene_type:complete
MRRLASMVAWDIGLQIRSHFYTATALTTAVIVGLIFLIPLDPLPAQFATLLVFVDPAVVGLTLVGAAVLMEKGANTLAALGVTPMPGWVYVGAKIISFTLLGGLSGLIIAVLAMRGGINYPVMLAALTLSNAVAVLIGFALVTRARSVNGFIVNIMLASIVLILPVIAYFDLAPPVVGALLKLIPTYAMLVLIEAGLSQDASPVGAIAAMVWLSLWTVAGWFWALRQYHRQLATGGL